jgi:hypothetical protein
MTKLGAQLPLAFATALCLVAAGAARAQGETTATPVALAEWRQAGGKTALVIPLAQALTHKQRAMIDGGFTTVSQLAIRLEQPDGTPPSAASLGDADDWSKEAASGLIYLVRCSVKFDAWEETYDVARLDAAPATGLIKDFAVYGDMCLKAEITAPATLERIGKSTTTLLARLAVKQTSLEEAAKIKDWLVQQQSGVMQSLFSHMLGELSLSQTLDVRVSVPTRPPEPPATETGAVRVPSPAAVEARTQPPASPGRSPPAPKAKARGGKG